MSPLVMTTVSSFFTEIAEIAHDGNVASVIGQL